MSSLSSKKVIERKNSKKSPAKVKSGRKLKTDCKQPTALVSIPRRLSERVAVDSAGRIVVPAKIRKALSIEGGQELSMTLEGDVIRLQTLDTAIENLQALARRKRKTKGSVVDDFIAERRVEAAKE